MFKTQAIGIYFQEYTLRKRDVYGRGKDWHARTNFNIHKNTKILANLFSIKYFKEENISYCLASVIKCFHLHLGHSKTQPNATFSFWRFFKLNML